MENKNGDDVQRIKVVIVEDDIELCQEIKNATDQTTDIIIAGTTDNHEDTIKLCKFELPDVILLDWKLKGCNGIDILKDIRRSGDIPNRPVILVMTENKSKTRFAVATGEGADFLIDKDEFFTVNGLIDEIRSNFYNSRRYGVNAANNGNLALKNTRMDSESEKVARLEDLIDARLHANGMRHGKRVGREYLIDLVVLAVQNGGMTNYILNDKYKIVAEKRDTTPGKAKRNLDTAIHKATSYARLNLPDQKHNPFLSPDPDETPTPVELISFYSYVFRNELK